MGAKALKSVNPADPTWWPHRFDATQAHFHFIRATREDHRAATFLTDEYLADANNPKAVAFADAARAAGNSPVHFVFHSAYCCSTLLARAFDLPGISMGLKEPQVLNDISGWRSRGARPEDVAKVMAGTLAVLSRPFEAGEANVIKPSNLVNGLAGLMLHVRPDAKALFLYAPLKDFLGSIARKGMWGRLWVRELLSKQLKEQMIPFGFQSDDYLRMTDLQAAAIGWLAQHALMMQVGEKFGADRIKTLCSVDLMANSAAAMTALFAHYGLSVPESKVQSLVEGPVFNKHSKTASDFDASAREAERAAGEKLYGEEIEKVVAWAETVATSAGVPLRLPNALI